MRTMKIECLNCPNAVGPVRRSYRQEECPVFDVEHPAKPGVYLTTCMDVEAGCLGGKIEGRGGTALESLQDAMRNSEMFINQNCPLKVQ